MPLNMNIASFDVTIFIYLLISSKYFCQLIILFYREADLNNNLSLYSTLEFIKHVHVLFYPQYNSDI